ncbi:MAG: prepilin-type N-terminal cleavage/methylation domain-containing protein [Rhodobacter sp.]|nr:prepilin-type N-terminal cleavage/methylation domain-containing protein [Paracoccaceae bacterium]MCC0076334.1 prepilin-type N-terminal cleavage/methylation domain-containing protein [Rhodobacter sp.]
MTRRDRGFTLIELLAGMAILAVVSIMAVQALSGALFQRDVLTRSDDDAAGMVRALALLRHDLEAVVPVPLGEEDGEPTPVIEAGPQGFTLVRAGIGPQGTFGRVAWRLSASGVLTRQVWPDPQGAGDPGRAVTVLEGVSALSLTARGGEMPGEADPLTLPPGFELVLDQTRLGSLRLVVAR